MKFKRLVPVFIIAFLYVLFFANVEYVKNSLLNSIYFCVKTLIPSVFPFILLSSLIVNTGIFNSFFLNDIFKPLYKLGICRIYLSSIVSGSLSGYVTGAKCICDITDKKAAQKDEFTNAVILSSNAGLGFVISCVGALIWKNLLFGIYIYFSQLIISLLLGALILPKAKDENTFFVPNEKGMINAITDSVGSAASSVIIISSYVISFSLLCDIASILLPSPLSTAIYPIMEFCNGAFKCLEFSNIYVKAFFTGFTVGFGGICVHFQIFSICNEFPLNKRVFFLFKLLQGILLGMVAIIYISCIHNIKALPIELLLLISVTLLIKIIFKRRTLSFSA